MGASKEHDDTTKAKAKAKAKAKGSDEDTDPVSLRPMKESPQKAGATW